MLLQTLSAKRTQVMTNVVPLVATLPWFAWIAIVAIVSSTVGGIVKTLIIHRERMAMIRQGIPPDAVAGAYKSACCDQSEI
jgi:hypothetical protein